MRRALLLSTVLPFLAVAPMSLPAPADAQGRPFGSQTAGTTQTPAILVYIGEDNLIQVNGRYTDLGGVRANMERLRAENPESALIIQAHPKAKTGTVIRIRDEAYNAQMDRVNVIRSADE